MPRKLYLFDTAPFIHAGRVNRHAKMELVRVEGTKYFTQTTPLGGVSLIFNTLYSVVGTGDIVFACDRNPTIKKDLIPGYKENRNHNDPDINIQKGAAEYLLEQCNCSVIARSGYEADDIIYTYVKRLRDQYDEIIIYTADSDLYFLVDEKVSVYPSSSRAKTVTRSNFDQVMAKKGIPYNTYTVNKILYGDTSDCIPGIRKDVADVIWTFVRDSEELAGKMGDKETVRMWMQTLGGAEVASRVDLVFPLEIDDLPMEFKKPDKEMIKNFGAAMHNRIFSGQGSPNFDPKPYVEEMQKRGYYTED